MASDCSTDFILPGDHSYGTGVTEWVNQVARDQANSSVSPRDPPPASHSAPARDCTFVADRVFHSPPPSEKSQKRPSSVSSKTSLTSSRKGRRSLLDDLATGMASPSRRQSAASVRAVPRPPRSSTARSVSSNVRGTYPESLSSPPLHRAQTLGVLPDPSQVTFESWEHSTPRGSYVAPAPYTPHYVPAEENPFSPAYNGEGLDETRAFEQRFWGTDGTPRDDGLPPTPIGVRAPSAVGGGYRDRDEDVQHQRHACYELDGSGVATPRPDRGCPPPRVGGHPVPGKVVQFRDRRDSVISTTSSVSIPPPPQSIAATHIGLDYFADEIADRVAQRLGSVRLGVPVVTGSDATAATHRRSRYVRPPQGSSRMATAVAAYSAGPDNVVFKSRR
ncbi:hypothetical protein [Alternaria alternata polymycovirus 1]|nr:hypothetical protein [Alternaria alternata polymycovirus 1]